MSFNHVTTVHARGGKLISLEDSRNGFQKLTRNIIQIDDLTAVYMFDITSK